MKSDGGSGRKTTARAKPRAQCGALAYRRSPGLEILLVTSRETGRWVIPKGWTMKSKTRREVAVLEALEEAGVEGKAARKPIGVYDYAKVLRSGEVQTCRVSVFALQVTAQRESWREQDQRSTQWFPWAAAAAAVNEPALKRLIGRFAKAKDSPEASSTSAADETDPPQQDV
jgi:8-oxo-dGTP pyrophosphatase MutT (NUDIX family)